MLSKQETRNWLTDLVDVSFCVCKQQSSPFSYRYLCSGCYPG